MLSERFISWEKKASKGEAGKEGPALCQVKAATIKQLWAEDW